VRCLRLLHDAARAVIVGHYFNGVTLRELTERLELDNPSGSRGVLISAQRKLKRCIEGRDRS
jgi:DNA-directed RNA polymerase specialized sigma24 family protein